MANFMYHLLKCTEDGKLFISHIKYAVGYVAREINIMLTDTFDEKLECVMDAVARYPSVFEITDTMSSVALKDSKTFKPDKIDDETKKALKACIEHMTDPLHYAGIDVSFADEKEKEICSSTRMMEFLVYMASNGKDVTTLSTKELNAEGLSHLVRLPNLYNLLSRYYSKNLMEKNNGRDEHSYIVSYNALGEEFCFEITKSTEILGQETHYKVYPGVKTREYVYFPDLALDVHHKDYTKKKKVYEQVEKALYHAACSYVPYELVSDLLERVYGHLDDDE